MSWRRILARWRRWWAPPVAERLELWSARLLTWANDVRLGDYRRLRQRHGRLEVR